MPPSEYEQRRRALEQQYQAALAMLRQGYQAKLEELEMIRLISGEPATAPTAAPAPSPVPSQTPPTAEAGRREEDTPAPLSQAGRQERGQVYYDLEEILPGLPEVFDRTDVIRALGYTPTRATLNRAFEWLLDQRLLVVEHFGKGPYPTSYRKKSPASPEEAPPSPPAQKAPSEPAAAPASDAPLLGLEPDRG